MFDGRPGGDRTGEPVLVTAEKTQAEKAAPKAVQGDQGGGKSRPPWLKIFGGLLLVTCLAVFSYFVVYNLVMGEARKCAPTEIASIVSGGGKHICGEGGHIPVAAVAADSQQPELRITSDPAVVQMAKARAYYNWYQNWYLIVALVFLGSFLAFFIGDAIAKSDLAGERKETKPQASSGTPPLSAKPRLILSSNLANFTIALSAISAVAAFAVNEYFKLIIGGGVTTFNPFWFNDIPTERWNEGANLIRLLYDRVGGNHSLYFAVFDWAIAASALVPLAIAYQLAIMGQLLPKVKKFVRDVVVNLAALLDQLRALLTPLVTAKASAVSALAGEKIKYADAIENLRSNETARLKALATLSEKQVRAAMVRDELKVLREYHQDLSLKREHVRDKAAGGMVDNTPPVESSLNQTVAALDECLLKLAESIGELVAEETALAEAIEGIKAQIANLEKTLESLRRLLDDLGATIAALKERIEGLDRQIAQIEAQIAATEAEEAVLKPLDGRVTEVPSGKSDMSVTGKEKSADHSFRNAVLFILTILLLFIGNWAMAPDLREEVFEFLAASIASPSFWTINLILVLALLVNGLVINISASPFFTGPELGFWRRSGLLALAVLVGFGLITGVNRWFPEWSLSPLKQPDGIGVAQLDCVAGDDKDTGLTSSAGTYVFGESGFVKIDTAKNCTFHTDRLVSPNYYIVLGTASMEPTSEKDAELSDGRAAITSQSVVNELKAKASRLRPPDKEFKAKVYSISLGRYSPSDKSSAAPSNAAGWATFAKAGAATEKVKLYNDLTEATAYQRKVVVVSGFSEALQPKAVNAETAAQVLGDAFCDGSTLRKTLFMQAFKVDPEQYERGKSLCENGRLQVE